MPGALPEGTPAPDDGLLPPSARSSAVGRNFGVYVHVPYCTVRCGYCDFNTYTTTDMPGVSQAEYAAVAREEIAFADQVLQRSQISPPPVSTVFFGGGTPTLLSAADIGSVISQVEASWALSAEPEITVEANPDSVDRSYLAQLVDHGVTRVSFGVQSFVPHVLATLERTHNPANVTTVVAEAKSLGLQVSVDLIYGTPGETATDWTHTLRQAVDLEPDHISAYSLIVEPGTALARRIRRGELSQIDDDTHAEFYEIADDILNQADYRWYEVSNWAKQEHHHSRHNLSYWTSENWWGVGPGAHSHIGGVRWWNVKHPKAYAERVRSGFSPAAAREILSEEEAYTEQVMLALRTSGGLDMATLKPGHQRVVAEAIADGLVDPGRALHGRLVLTRKGRLLADGLGLRLVSAGDSSQLTPR